MWRLIAQTFIIIIYTYTSKAHTAQRHPSSMIHARLSLSTKADQRTIRKDLLTTPQADRRVLYVALAHEHALSLPNAKTGFYFTTANHAYRSRLCFLLWSELASVMLFIPLRCVNCHVRWFRSQIFDYRTKGKTVLAQALTVQPYYCPHIRIKSHSFTLRGRIFINFQTNY